MKRNYDNQDKPLDSSGNNIIDGNMGSQAFEKSIFALKGRNSFNGFSGVAEFEAFPLRQLFLNEYGLFPYEWDTGYFNLSDLQKYISENERYVVVKHYRHNGEDVSRCVLKLGGKEKLFIYIYMRSYYASDPDADSTYGLCLLFSKKTKRVQNLMDYFKKLVIPDEKKEIGYLNILVKAGEGYALENKEINCPDIDFNINYNEDFELTHKLILDRLSIKKSKGLVLLHGKAGTGKTTYIRYLINTIKKKIIYIPPNLTDIIADPALIKFFLNHSDSILVIEDGENVLMKRGKNASQAVANILNLTDGLLSDCANIQIVATFNTDIINIDEALLRKGRLIAKYEFKPLSKDRVVKLSSKLNVKINGEHTLADIYNADEKSFNQEKKGISFNR